MRTGAIGEDARVAVHPFDLDTDVKDLGEGHFGAEMSERWWVERGPNGGYVAAVILRAIQAAAEIERAPRSLTVQFPRAPVAGPVEITVRTEREGRTVTFLSARMEQQGKLQATALAVLADDLDANGFEELKMPSVEPPAELYSPDPEQVAGMPTMFQNYSVRPVLGDEAFSGGASYSGLWIRAREPRLLDAPLAAAILDAWFPAPFIRLERPVPAPTIDYTVHFRAPLPEPAASAEDPYLATFRSGLARGGFFEEDGELWSQDGSLLAQSRQLALLLN
ncbi:MAG TPA: thioesterase family protein [Solirubrobacterales bacterium]|nr:thioesterase family protein [Solirubrobacterales bacterium]